jgi:hypothetical protein
MCASLCKALAAQSTLPLDNNSEMESVCSLQVTCSMYVIRLLLGSDKSSNAHAGDTMVLSWMWQVVRDQDVALQAVQPCLVLWQAGGAILLDIPCISLSLHGP